MTGNKKLRALISCVSGVLGGREIAGQRLVEIGVPPYNFSCNSGRAGNTVVALLKRVPGGVSRQRYTSGPRAAP